MHKTAQISSKSLQNLCYFLFQQGIISLSKLNRYLPTQSAQNSPNLGETLHISSQVAEISPNHAFRKQIPSIQMALANNHLKTAVISTQSATHFGIPDASVDYIFIAPPLNGNLPYSALHFLPEAWLNVFSNRQTPTKDFGDYWNEISNYLTEAFRLLKSGHWLTLAFTGTQASVWHKLQTVLQQVGFIIANISTLYHQPNHSRAITPTAVKQDLMIQAYKPNADLENRFEQLAGSKAGIWAFLQSHLQKLPIAKLSSSGKPELMMERQAHILYERMVTYFLQHNYLVPLTRQTFLAELPQHFVQRDNMIFLPEQVVEYERLYHFSHQAPQMEIAIFDERSTIDWLHHFLTHHPATYQELSPIYLCKLGAGWKTYEIVPELDKLLKFHFLKYNGKGKIPASIYHYLSKYFKQVHHISADEKLIQKHAKSRWYLPDAQQASQLALKREKQLLRDFATYCQNPKKRLKQFRLEAIHAGFQKAWKEDKYHLIIQIAKQLPDSVLPENDKLLLWYDQALMRISKT